MKYHFAVHNCYGVDLNPLAADLGKVSLWLNTLHQGAIAPYLDLRIQTGNSLIGARRELFRAPDLTRKASKKAGENWLSMVPERAPLGTPRPEDGVYHFLLPDAGMAPFENDKVLKGLEPESAAKLKAWRKAFTEPLTDKEVARLLKLSERVDALWTRHLAQRQDVLEKTRRTLTLWGQPEPEPAKKAEDAQTLEEIGKQLEDLDAPGQLLKLVMDYWCALWFWPLREADQLPTREEWMRDVEAVLAGKGEKASAERIALVQTLADDKRFFHWELSFAEVFAERGGMDVILGNPPWRKVEWNEGDVLADFDAALAVKKLSAKVWSDRRDALLGDEAARAVFEGEAEEAAGTGAYLNAVQSYPLLKGVQTNLYKCFIASSWRLGSQEGAFGFLHQPGVYDDSKGGALRSAIVGRAVLVARFKNELMLFPEVDHQRPFALSVLRAASRSVDAQLFANLLHPSTMDDSLDHDGRGLPPGIKTEQNDWDLRGHRSRLVPIDEDELGLFARLYDEPNTPALEARLPVVHSIEVLEVLRRFARAPKSLADLEGEYFATEHFHETNAQKDGTIRREVRFPKSVNEWIVSGPHFYVGNPLNKTPNEGCSHNQDYSSLDLTQLPDDYLPRTNYVRTCSPADYRERTPKWNGRPVTEFYRWICRKMVAPTGERTLVPSVLPVGAAHIHGVISVAFASTHDMVGFLAMTCSLVSDFFVKSSGVANLNPSAMGGMALFPEPLVSSALIRALRLNCLTVHYAALWEELYDSAFRKDAPTTSDPRAGSYGKLTAAWQRDVAFRPPFARRQALVELDALAALALGMTLDELKLIYRIQFPVLSQYERDTFYDQRGKVVFTANRGQSDVGLARKRWEELRSAKKGDKLPAWAHDQQGPFVPPFDKCDREEDMAQAYEVFSERLAVGRGPGVKSARPHEQGERYVRSAHDRK